MLVRQNTCLSASAYLIVIFYTRSADMGAALDRDEYSRRELHKFVQGAFASGENIRLPALTKIRKCLDQYAKRTPTCRETKAQLK